MSENPCGTCGQCCSFPTKGHAALELLVGFTTLIMSYYATGDCSFVEQNNVYGGSYGFGLYNREHVAGAFTDNQYSCVVYEDVLLDQFFDSPFQAGRAFGVMGNIFVVISFAMTMSLSCCLMNDLGRKCMGLSYFMASLCHSLIFIMFASDLCNVSECSIGVASGVNIGVILLAMINGCMSMRLPLENESARMMKKGTHTAGQEVPPPTSLTVAAGGTLDEITNDEESSEK